MAKRKPTTKKPASHEKPVKIEGTYEELIRRSLTAKKPKQGWLKRR